MTKLEEKLIELEYIKSSVKGFYNKYLKWCYIRIYFNEDNTIKYEWCGVQRNHLGVFQTQEQIDNLQLAFNEMQRDLKELELCLEELKKC